MLTIVFNKLATPVPKSLERGKHYTIYGAIQLLTELEVLYQSQQIEKEIEFQVLDDQSVIYEDKLKVGQGHGSELISYIEERLFQLFPNEKEEINQLMDKINDSYLEYTTIEAPVAFVKEEPAKNVVRKVDPPKNIKAKTTQTVNFKKIRLLFFVSILTCALIVAGIFCANMWSRSTVTQEKETLESYLSQENYLAAGEKYATRHKYIENHIFTAVSHSTSESDKNAELIKLKSFNKKYPTEQGAFDLAYLAKEYRKVTERKAAADTNDRLAMLGFSLVKIGEIDSAREVNEKLKSSGLEKMIAQYEVYEKQINFYKDQLRVEGLTQTEKEKFESMQNYYEVQQKTLGESTNEG